jgi:hypothetical protein
MRALAMFQRYPFRQSPTWSWQRETKRAFGAVMAPSLLGRYLISRMHSGLYDLVDQTARDRFESKRQPL